MEVNTSSILIEAMEADAAAHGVQVEKEVEIKLDMTLRNK